MSASPPFSLHWTETSPILRRDTRIMPVFRDYSQAKRTSESARLTSNAVIAPAFLRKAHAQSGFQEIMRRMQCDQKLGSSHAG
jgi:hypothetical protein